jgi:hypothetical protein
MGQQLNPFSLAIRGEGRYRIELDESWYHEHPEVRAGNQHWYETIPCRGGGLIYLYSETENLLVLLTPAKLGQRVLQEVAGAWLRGQPGEETEILFPAEALHQVAEIARARRKRRLSPEHKAKLTEADKAHRFQAKSPVLEMG